MHHSTTLERSLDVYTDSWRDENSRGLACAAAGHWSDAADAFTTAADDVAQHGDVATHDALALVLNNLAQACLHDGRVDDAIRHAQRSCALRVALVGEDAVAVARARSELAVILGSADRASEGLALIRRAIASIERSAGDEDIRLLTVLENAARLAMAAGQPSTAEPYLLRLHALLDANGMSVEIAETLLSRVVGFRLEQQIRSMESMTAPTPTSPMVEVDAFGDDDDAPLRDAVAITDVLLRNTPTSNRAITPMSPIEALVVEDDVEAFEVVTGEDLTDELDVDAERAPQTVVRDIRDIASEELEILTFAVAAETPAPNDIFGGASFDLIELDAPVDVPAVDVAATATPRTEMFVELDLVTDDVADDMFELVPMNTVQQAPVADSDGGLGFTVEYGATSDAMTFDMEPANNEAPTTLDRDLSDSLIPAPQAAPTFEANTDHVAPQRTTPRGTLLVMPTPQSSKAVKNEHKSGRTTSHDDAAPRLVVQDVDNTGSNRQPRKPVLRAGRASAPKSSSGILIASGVAATILAGAGWFFMMGR